METRAETDRKRCRRADFADRLAVVNTVDVDCNGSGKGEPMFCRACQLPTLADSIVRAAIFESYTTWARFAGLGAVLFSLRVNLDCNSRIMASREVAKQSHDRVGD